MWCYINTKVATKLGFSKASILEHFFMHNPHNNEAKFNISNASVVLPISLSTAQKCVKELVQENYLIKHSRSAYSFSDKFFTTFPEYKLKTIEL